MEIDKTFDLDEPASGLKLFGLTGGIGSGKSTVAKILEQNGYPVYYSDDRAKDIVNDNLELKEKIKTLLGDDSYTLQGEYNRKYVSEQIFQNDDLRLALNGLIHPAVKLDFEKWILNQNSKIVFKETALLFELKLNESCDKSVLVTADDRVRMKRVMDRDNKTYRQVETVMLKQMPEKEKCKLADYIIYNNSTIEDLELETQRFIEEIK